MMTRTQNFKMMGWGTAMLLSAAFIGTGAIAQTMVDTGASLAIAGATQSVALPMPTDPVDPNGAAATTPEEPDNTGPAQGQVSSAQGVQTPGSPQQEAYRKKREEQLLIALDNAYQKNILVRDPGLKPDQAGNLLFTIWEHMLLDEWRKGVTTATPLPTEKSTASGANVITGPREISLAGIAYVNNDSWTIWMNGQRMKPDSLPREVMDIDVHKQYIDLKWFDAATNLIYPVRLRPHQRFNLDTRIFLPGTPAGN